MRVCRPQPAARLVKTATNVTPGRTGNEAPSFREVCRQSPARGEAGKGIDISSPRNDRASQGQTREHRPSHQRAGKGAAPLRAFGRPPGMIVDDSAGPWYGYGEMTAQSFPPRLITLNRWRTIPSAGL